MALFQSQKRNWLAKIKNSADYFVDDPLHGDRRYFRMNQKLFMNILLVVREYETHFICKIDCVSTIGFSSNQKCTTALKDASLWRTC
jgi:hypothetical protein